MSMARSWTAVLTVLVVAVAPLAKAVSIHVSPNSTPSLSDALASAKAGDTIHLNSGYYNAGIMSTTHGTEHAPITITGPRDAVVGGVNPDTRIVTINHSHIHLKGFTVDGKMEVKEGRIEMYANKCIYVHGETTPTSTTYMGHTFPSSVNGLVISDMSIKNCQGECIRLRYFVTHSDIQDNDVQNCGVDDFVFNNKRLEGSKNGEGLYIGTQRNEWHDGENPDDRPDASSFNLVKNNIFFTHGNECVEIKEGTEHNVVEGNQCGGQRDAGAACYASRGDHNVFRNNKGDSCEGAGIHLGGTSDYGINNKVYRNTVKTVSAGALKVMKFPQEICGNACTSGDCSIVGAEGGRFASLWDKECPQVIGTNLQPFGVVGKSDYTPYQEKGGKEGFGMKFQQEPEHTSAPSIMSEDQKSETTADTAEEQEDSGGKGVGAYPAACLSVTVEHDSISSSGATSLGHPAINLMDGDISTRWSAKGSGESVMIEFGEKRLLAGVYMSVFEGASRAQSFEIKGDNDQVLVSKRRTSGETDDLEFYPFSKVEATSSVTLYGYGNSRNAWNSISRLELCGAHDKSSGPTRADQGVIERRLTGAGSSTPKGNPLRSGRLRGSA
ncbi:unnamed protein product [Discosporangium mesarthrocarpum]